MSKREYRMSSKMLIEYFWEQGHHESWPVDVLFGMANILFPEYGPFAIVTGEGDTVSDEGEDDCFYAHDVRGQDGKPLPSLMRG